MCLEEMFIYLIKYDKDEKPYSYTGMGKCVVSDDGTVITIDWKFYRYMPVSKERYLIGKKSSAFDDLKKYKTEKMVMLVGKGNGVADIKVVNGHSIIYKDDAGIIKYVELFFDSVPFRKTLNIELVDKSIFSNWPSYQRKLEDWDNDREI